MRILVVCVGNVCRSPVAERLLSTELERLERPATVSSAGVRAMVGHPIDRLAAAELVRLGGDPTGFAATQVSQELVEEADLVLTATRAVRSRVLELAPRALRRSFTLREFELSAPTVLDGRDLAAPSLVGEVAARRGTVAPELCDIADPVGRSADVHRQVAEQVAHSVQVIAATLAATRADPSD